MSAVRPHSALSVQDLDSKQSSRGRWPWQELYSQSGVKRGPSLGGGDQQDSSWEFADSSSDDDEDSDEDVMRQVKVAAG